jgi:2-dehydropantoate 2-reductase
MANLKIAVFGAGGVGGYFAGTLTRAGYPVALIARGKQLEAIRRDGLRVEGPNETFTVQLAQATDKPGEVGPVDAIILAVKAWQVTDAAESFRPMVGVQTKVLPFENGVEAPEQLEKVLGREHVLVGLCRIISAVVGPGHIRHAGMQPMIAIGEVENAPLSRIAQDLVEAFRASGASVDTPKDIQAALWEKLIFIAGMSGVGGVTRATIGEIRQCAPTRELLEKMFTEVAAVATARGIKVSSDYVARTMAFVDTLPVSGTASMQRDIADGKPSELEAIIGSVVRFGHEAGVATAVTNYIYASLLPQEQRARSGK